MAETEPISLFARTPEPPYLAVIFTSLLREGDDGYADMAGRMMELALAQPGCLGAESARDARGFGLTVAYFSTEADIAAWRDHAEHRLAQELGRTKWYAHYEVRVARVERAYSGPEKR
jgi:heme-degrading monooxygenase HmoA